ncbi:MAG: MotA/TolQ/ExbB proton channel family protein, partial [Cyanobacteria bacterium J06638_6]
EALITTAAGMVVAIIALLVFRVMVTLQAQQIDYFSDAGNELELIYRQYWYEPSLTIDPNHRSDLVTSNNPMERL